MDKLIALDLPPGFRNTGTVYQSKGRWYTGNLVRFFGDTIQPLGGWVARTLTASAAKTALTAASTVPRAMVTFRNNVGTQVLVVGTTQGIYAIVGSNVYDISPAGLSNVTARVWQFEVFGGYVVAVDLTAPSTTGKMYHWTGDTSVLFTNTLPFDGSRPTAPISVVATPERFLVALAARYTAVGWGDYGLQDRYRLVTWATQEGGFTASDWVPSASNTAGDFTLQTEGSIVCGRRTRGLTLIWTTTDLHSMTYIGGTLVYRFDQVANNCGIIASHAVAVTDAGAYWMGENGFFRYDGFVRPVPCEVHDHVFGSLNRTYAHYIWAIENPMFGEVTWFYPHAAQTEITRYVTYNYREEHWVTGTLSRTAGVPHQPGTNPYPVMAKALGVIYDHESGTARDGEGTPSLESGPIEIADGDRLMGIQKVVPDDKTAGDVTLTLYTAPNPDTAEATNGPYTLSAQTSIRVQARQVRMKLTEAVATAWRVGVVRLGVVLGSRR